MFKTAVPPGVAEPDPIENPTFWAEAKMPVTNRKRMNKRYSRTVEFKNPVLSFSISIGVNLDLLEY
jgi:hypothetical protein